ncbi:MAG: hypothetical protein JXO22_02670 [Phycisphaerae bacterium]|nr:hypothetical protein [Phycisphaerae bacterium]
MSVRQTILVTGIMLLLFGGATGAPADALTPERQREILRTALTDYDRAVELAPTNPDEAARLWRDVAGAFNRLVDSGLRSEALFYNLGNTYARLEDTGRAVLNYRRAQRLNPGNTKVEHNLARVSTDVTPRLEPNDESRLWRRVLFWHYTLSPRARFWIAVALSIFGWAFLLLRLRWHHNGLLAVGVIVVLGGVGAGSSVLWQLHDEAHHPPAVIVADKHELRLGPGAGYDPVLREPLGPGIEFRILSTRGDWLEIELPDGQTGWITATNTARLLPPM